MTFATRLIETHWHVAVKEDTFWQSKVFMKVYNDVILNVSIMISGKCFVSEANQFKCNTRLHPFARSWLYNATAVRGAVW